MRLEPKEEGIRWLLQAEQDLDDARHNFLGNRFHLACFLSQQAAEKAVKAFIYAGLDKYYIPTRYPNGLPGGLPFEAFDEDDGNKAIGMAEKVVKHVGSAMEMRQG